MKRKNSIRFILFFIAIINCNSVWCSRIQVGDSIIYSSKKITVMMVNSPFKCDTAEFTISSDLYDVKNIGIGSAYGVLSKLNFETYQFIPDCSVEKHLLIFNFTSINDTIETIVFNPIKPRSNFYIPDKSNFKFTPSVIIETEGCSALPIKYSNGNLSQELIDSKTGYCDSIIKFYSNGKISCTVRLFSYLDKLNQNSERIREGIDYVSYQYYSNGQLAIIEKVDGAKKDKIFFANEKLIYVEQGNSDSVLSGCLVSNLDEENLMINLFYDGEHVGQIQFYLPTEKITNYEVFNDSILSKKSSPVMHYFNDEYFLNLEELLISNENKK